MVAGIIIGTLLFLLIVGAIVAAIAGDLTQGSE